MNLYTILPVHQKVKPSEKEANQFLFPKWLIIIEKKMLFKVLRLKQKMKDDLLRYGVIDCMSFVCLFLLSLYFFLLFDLKILFDFFNPQKFKITVKTKHYKT